MFRFSCRRFPQVGEHFQQRLGSASGEGLVEIQRLARRESNDVQPKIRRCTLDNLRRHTPQLPGIGGNKCVIADGIDQPRDTFGMEINRGNRILRKQTIAGSERRRPAGAISHSPGSQLHRARPIVRGGRFVA